MKLKSSASIVAITILYLSTGCSKSDNPSPQPVISSDSLLSAVYHIFDNGFTRDTTATAFYTYDSYNRLARVITEGNPYLNEEIIYEYQGNSMRPYRFQNHSGYTYLFYDANDYIIKDSLIWGSSAVVHKYRFISGGVEYSDVVPGTNTNNRVDTILQVVQNGKILKEYLTDSINSPFKRFYEYDNNVNAYKSTYHYKLPAFYAQQYHYLGPGLTANNITKRYAQNPAGQNSAIYEMNYVYNQAGLPIRANMRYNGTIAPYIVYVYKAKM